jgi:hypothetical protein
MKTVIVVALEIGTWHARDVNKAVINAKIDVDAHSNVRFNMRT